MVILTCKRHRLVICNEYRNHIDPQGREHISDVPYTDSQTAFFIQSHLEHGWEILKTV